MKKTKRDVQLKVLLVFLFGFYHLNMMACSIYTDARIGWSGPWYYIKEAVMVMGFLSFALSRRLSGRVLLRKILFLSSSLLYCGTLLIVMFSNDRSMILSGSMLAMFAVGHMGGATYYILAAGLFGRKNGGLLLAAGMTLATIGFYVPWGLIGQEKVMLAVMIAGFLVITYIVVRPMKDWVFLDLLPYSGKTGNETEQTAQILKVTIMSAVIGILLISKTDAMLINGQYAEISEIMYRISRFLAIPAYFITGLLHDLKKKDITIVLLLASAVLLLCFPQDVGAEPMFISLLGFLDNLVIANITLAFFDVAPRTGRPELWASFGRVLMLIDAVVGQVFLRIPKDGHAINYICTTALALILMSIGILVVKEEGARVAEEKHMEEAADTHVRRLMRIKETYGLTPRETDVFDTVLSMPHASVSLMAEKLEISRTMMYRYINSISEKTGVSEKEKWKEL